MGALALTALSRVRSSRQMPEREAASALSSTLLQIVLRPTTDGRLSVPRHGSWTRRGASERRRAAGRAE